MAQSLPKKVIERLTENPANNQRLTLNSNNTLTARAREYHYSVYITNSGPDGTFEFDVEDFTPDTMAVANAMPVGLKEEAHEQYKLKIGTNIVSLKKTDGKPQPINDNAPGAENSYMDDIETNDSHSEAKSSFNALSEPSKYTDYGIKVIKGKSEPTSNEYKKYITEIISSINEFGGEANFPKATERLLSEQKYNRFSSVNVALKHGQKEDEQNFGDIIIQQVLGEHKTQAFKTIPDAASGILPTNTPTINSANIRLKNLKNLGIQILLKASGEYYVAEDTDDIKSTIIQKATSMAPGLARLGIKVPVNSFLAENVMYEVNKNFVKPKNRDLKDEQNFSHGSYNNPIAPFDGFDSRSSAAASAILISTITTLFEALSVVFSPKGGLQSPIIGDIFNVINNAPVPTKNSYSDCVREGAKVFFGLESGGEGLLGSIFGAFTSGLSRFNDEPGYYNLILRNLVKIITYELFGSIGSSLMNLVSAIPLSLSFGSAIAGTLGINANIKNIGLSGQVTNDSGLDIQQPGLSNDPTNILGAIRGLLNSRLIGFMNVLANIGDIAISLKEAGLDAPSGKAHGGDTLDDSYDDIDRSTNKLKLASLIYKNNLSPEASMGIVKYTANGRPLSWGTSTTPSMYILPDAINVGAARLGSPDGVSNKLKRDPSMRTSDINRLNAGMVKEIEEELDAAYIPFYFHDLRTNEIVSFHAFLETINDSFDVEYAESSGYGRIGKVYTYKNTNRSIAMSFKVVATNPDDFDRMWWKINKLTTLLYPQYTAGRVVETEDGNKFIQPFSQLPAASPLIRIRLGDIFRSNYSKFNLARLFGVTLGEEQFKLSNGAGIVNANAVQAEAIASSITQNTDRIRMGNLEPLDTLIVHVTNPGGPLSFDSSATMMFAELNEQGIPFLNTITPTYKPITLPGGDYRIQIQREIIGEPAQEYRAYIVSIIDNPIFSTKTYILRVPKTVGLDSTLNTVLNTATNVIASAVGLGTSNPRRNGRAQNVNRSIELRLDPEGSIMAAANVIGQDAQEAALEAAAGNLESDVQKFFKTENNPVFKAFETTKGKGLAGFIKNMRFNWGGTDGPTWTIDGIDNRAPKFCTIELEFAPIHDLSPGIDVNGFNTAPIYRVGSLSNAVNSSIGEDKAEHDADVRSFDKKSHVVIKGPTNRDGLTAVAGQLIGGSGFNPRL